MKPYWFMLSIFLGLMIGVVCGISLVYIVGKVVSIVAIVCCAWIAWKLTCKRTSRVN